MADNQNNTGGCAGCNKNGTPALNPFLTRHCCLECVEKHLGAAWVLLRELQEGYAHHRLLFIGHLHEAESESVAWPMLSLSIRAMRKRFQETGEFPNFYVVSKLLQQCRAQSQANAPAPENEQHGEESNSPEEPSIPDT